MKDIFFFFIILIFTNTACTDLNHNIQQKIHLNENWSFKQVAKDNRTYTVGKVQPR